MKYFKITSLVFLLAACGINATPQHVYKYQNIPFPTLDSFPHCRSYGCKKVDISSLSDKEQSIIKNVFKSNNSAEKEIQNIKKSISLFEKIIGEKTGTKEDVAGTFLRLGHLQQDCIDESVNTTTYLLLLSQMNLLKFHDVNALTSRAPILSGHLGGHRTAVIIQKDNGQKLAVDSWFHDNGVEPEIIDLTTWKHGWSPNDN